MQVKSPAQRSPHPVSKPMRDTIMFKDILVPCVTGRIDEPAVRAACALAGEGKGGHVTALAGVSIVSPVVTAWAYYPAGVYATMHESADATVKALGDRFRARLARETVAHEVRLSDQFWLTPSEQATLHARYADLVVLGIDRESGDIESKLFAGLLLGSGRPLLLVPPEAPEEPSFRRAVVAWKPTREGARALHDAMPLLERCDAIDLLMVEGDYKSQPHHDASDVHILAHLERHGLKVDLVRRPGADASAGRAILSHASECGADFIVAGGYGHARALEMVMGGATRDLFEHTTVPVLFSH